MGSPLLEQFRKGGVTRDVRMTAATGVLPLTTSDQAELLCLLTRDREEEIRQKAEKSLAEIAEDDLLAVVKDRSIDPKVLQFYGTRSDSAKLLETIILNPSTEDVAIQEMVPRLSSDLLELVVINQTRLLRRPAIIEALEASEVLSSDQRRRLTELKHDFKLGAQAEAAPVAKTAEVYVNLDEGPPEQEAPPPLSVEEATETYRDEREEASLDEEGKKKREGIVKRLVKMSAAEKMIEGLKGDREARMMLIRDRNRVVYSAVLASPKLTDAEVDAFAAMRNVSPEVLRTVGGRRDWVKRYSVSHELVKNPLTPVEISMKLISRLNPRDLKRLTRDRNVPELVRRQASKLTQSQR
jgi:hypothetical protein